MQMGVYYQRAKPLHGTRTARHTSPHTPSQPTSQMRRFHLHTVPAVATALALLAVCCMAVTCVQAEQLVSHEATVASFQAAATPLTRPYTASWSVSSSAAPTRATIHRGHVVSGSDSKAQETSVALVLESVFARHTVVHAEVWFKVSCRQKQAKPTTRNTNRTLVLVLLCSPFLQNGTVGAVQQHKPTAVAALAPPSPTTTATFVSPAGVGVASFFPRTPPTLEAGTSIIRSQGAEASSDIVWHIAEACYTLYTTSTGTQLPPPLRCHKAAKCCEVLPTKFTPQTPIPAGVPTRVEAGEASPHSGCGPATVWQLHEFQPVSTEDAAVTVLYIAAQPRVTNKCLTCVTTPPP